MQDVEGYIHNVSPIKTTASGNRYFDFKIQVRVDTTRVVCFKPDKWETLKQKEAAKSPVRIVSVSLQKRKYEPDTMEYEMGTKSKVINTTNMPSHGQKSVIINQRKFQLATSSLAIQVMLCP